MSGVPSSPLPLAGGVGSGPGGPSDLAVTPTPSPSRKRERNLAADFPGLANPDGTRWHYLDTAATAQ